MQFYAVGWHAGYPPSYIGFANYATLALVLVVIVEIVIYFRKKWKNNKK